MRPLTGKGKDLMAFLCLNALLAVSGWIATSGFKRSQALVDVSQDPTPLGYTKSPVLVWTLSTWAAVMVYETVLSVLRIKAARPDRTIREALRGEDRDVEPLKRYYP